MYYHYRKTRKKYLGFPNSERCDFCHPEQAIADITKETAHAYVILNRVFYDQWETRRVTDHKLIIPKRHVPHFGELTKTEQADIMDLIAEYELAGYDIYARSPHSVSRSVPHQHTHLIKTEDKPSRGMIYFSRPYFVWRLK